MFNLKGWQNLGNAIIMQAVSDYRVALRALKRNPDNKGAAVEALRIEEFFNSSLYSALTDVDGEYLIRRLRSEAGEKTRKIDSRRAQEE